MCIWLHSALYIANAELIPLSLEGSKFADERDFCQMLRSLPLVHVRVTSAQKRSGFRASRLRLKLQVCMAT